MKNPEGNGTYDELFELNLEFEMDYLKLGNSQAHCITYTGASYELIDWFINHLSSELIIDRSID